MSASPRNPQTQSPSSSSSSPKPRWNYDVFLSFRGENVRRSFADHLYAALIHAGISTFRDDDEIERGESIGCELKKAIKESRISIIVFSKDYAGSSWCLDELAEIMECRKTIDQVVLPVFYDVDPSVVRKQTKSYGNALAQHEGRFVGDIERVERWRAALTEAANLSGFVLRFWHESKFIKSIVKKVLRIVNTTYLHVAMHPVGIHSRVLDINPLLNIGSDDVRMIGIYGMGGAGKTTIAKAVYNRYFEEFEGSCFLANVREVSEQPNGYVHLQEQLLSELLKIKNFKVGSVDRGIICMKEKLCAKKFLIVLDDLNNLTQVNSLAGECEWFGPGSRIIMTTRDEHLLIQANIDWRYKTKELKYGEPLELFSLHAFKTRTPVDEYLKLSKGIVAYVGGLPLALEVLGGYLYGRTMKDWNSAFKKLGRIPNNQILEKLRISYDGLDDDVVKDIFLDIACFFIGMDKDYAMNILNSCEFFPDIGITVLINRSLLTIDEKNKLMMHNLIRDMGREIVQQESRNKPGNRSRLWANKDVSYVLEKHKGTESIQGVVPVLPMSKEKPIISKTFEGMHKLRLLQINYAHFKGCFKHLPDELKWFSWHHCPLNYLPSDFLLENLVVLDLQYSNINSVWQGTKFLENLKILNLSHSSFLTRTPDFTGVPNLETLFLNGCTSLFEFDPSIALLHKLTCLILEDCKKLINLPDCICKLRSLEHLNLNGCSNLEELPENIQNLEHLRELFADGTAIKQLPSSLGHLKSLTSLSFEGCDKNLPAESRHSPCPSSVSSIGPDSRLLPASISSLFSLRMLNLSNRNLSDGDIPAGLWTLSSLQSLWLDGNNFHSLPSGIAQLSKLELLSLNRCRALQSLPEVPPKLVWLHATGCTSLEELPNLSNINKYLHLYLMNSRRLASIQGLQNLSSIQLIAIEGCTDLATNFEDSFFQGYSEHAYTSNMYLTRRDIPDWFSHQTMGSSISFDIPSDAENKFLGMTLWLVYEAKEDGPVMTHSPEAIIMNRINGVELRHTFPLGYGPRNPGRHSWVCHIPLDYFGYPIEGGEEMEVSFDINQPLEVKECGVHLIFRPKIDEDDQGQFPFVNSNVNTAEIIVENMSFERPRSVELVVTISKFSEEDTDDSKNLRLEFDPSFGRLARNKTNNPTKRKTKTCFWYRICCVSLFLFLIFYMQITYTFYNHWYLNN